MQRPILMFWVPLSHYDLVRTGHFCIHLLDMLSQVTLLVFLTKDYGHSLRKGLIIDFHPGLTLLNTGILSRKHVRRIVNAGQKQKKVSECMPWKSGFLCIIKIRINYYTLHTHLYKQPFSRSVKSLKKKMEKLHHRYVFAPVDKAANNMIIISKHNVEVFKGELNSTSTYVTAQLTKNKFLVHHINTHTFINVEIDKWIYLLPKITQTSLYITFYIKYEKRLLPRCIHHLKSDWIKNMDHMCISDTEPSSVILSQTELFQKLERVVESVLRQVKVTGLLPYFLSILHLPLQLSKTML